MPRAAPSPYRTIRPLLQRLGLEEREVEVYLALLSMKIGRVSAIARAAKQSRSHTYLVLRTLEEKGLVSEIERGKIKHFVAEQPERLLGYLKNRAQEIHELEKLIGNALPFLQTIKHPLEGEPRVSVMRGLEGIKQRYRDVLTQPFVSFFNPQVDYDAFGGNIAHMLFGPEVKLCGKDLLVHNAAAERYIREIPPHDAYAIRLLPKGITFDADVIVFEDEVSVFLFAEEPFTVRIESHAFANAVRAWFQPLWEMSTPVPIQKQKQ